MGLFPSLGSVEEGTGIAGTVTAGFVLAGDTQVSWRWGALVLLSSQWNEARKKATSLVKSR